MTQEEVKKYLKYFSETNIIVNLEGEIELKHDALASAIAKKRSKEEEELIEARQLLKSTYKNNTPLSREQFAILNAQLPLLNPSQKEVKFVKDSGRRLYKAEARERRRQQVEKLVLVAFIIFLVGLSATAIYQWRKAATTRDQLSDEKQKLKAKRISEYLRFGNDQAMIAEYPKAIDNYRKALELSDTVSQLIQDSIELWNVKTKLNPRFESLIQQGDSAYINKDYGKALQHYKEALLLNYYNSQVKKKLNELDKKIIPIVKQYVSNAKRFMEVRTPIRVKYAIRALENAKKLKPNDPEVLRLLKEYKPNQ